MTCGFPCEEWKVITIDDRVPSLPWNRTSIQNLSAKVVDHKIMVPLIEKAMAKLCPFMNEPNPWGLGTWEWPYLRKPYPPPDNFWVASWFNVPVVVMSDDDPLRRFTIDYRRRFSPPTKPQIHVVQVHPWPRDTTWQHHRWVVTLRCGSYTKLTSGMATTAWAHMTGCCDIVKIWGRFEFPMIWAPWPHFGIGKWVAVSDVLKACQVDETFSGITEKLQGPGNALNLNCAAGFKMIMIAALLPNI